MYVNHSGEMSLPSPEQFKVISGDDPLWLNKVGFKM
jgi:hypothetical protein